MYFFLKLIIHVIIINYIYNAFKLLKCRILLRYVKMNQSIKVGQQLAMIFEYIIIIPCSEEE